jgi:hypothetical protein
VIMYTGADGPLYAFSLFLPSIIKEVRSISLMSFNQTDSICSSVRPECTRANALSTSRIGYKATPANLLSVPVYAFACVVTCLVGFSADRYGHRGYFNLYADPPVVPPVPHLMMRFCPTEPACALV